MPFLRDQLASYLSVNVTEQNSMSWFQTSNHNMGFIKLVQTRYNSTSCNFNRFTYNSSDTYCLDPSNMDKNPFMNYTYNQDNSTSKNLLEGIYQDYDNSGYNITIQLNTITSFYNIMNNLIAVRLLIKKINWVDYKTKSFMMIMNFYNVNFDLFMTVRVLFENMQDYFIGYVDFGLTDITPTSDIYYILSIVFSFFNVVSLINSLITKNEKKLESDKDNSKLIQKELDLSHKMQAVFCFVCNFMRKNFRCPNFFEAISKNK